MDPKNKSNPPGQVNYEEYLNKLEIGDTLDELVPRTKSLPQNAKVSLIAEKLIPTKKQSASVKIYNIVQACVDKQLIEPRNASLLFDAIMGRYRDFNSPQSTSKVTDLADAIKSAKTEAGMYDSMAVKELSSNSLLTEFYNTIYRTVNTTDGQTNFEQFKLALLDLVTNYGDVASVYRSGSVFYLVIHNREKTFKLNLNTSFDNLQRIWGLDITDDERLIATSDAFLNPNTRLLLQYVAAVATPSDFVPGTYIKYKINLYKLTYGIEIEHVVEVELNYLADAYQVHGLDYKPVSFQKDGPEVPVNKSDVPITRPMLEIVRFIQNQFVGKQHLREITPFDKLEEIFITLPRKYVVNYPGFINALKVDLLQVAEEDPDMLITLMLDQSWRPSGPLYDYANPQYTLGLDRGTRRQVRMPDGFMPNRLHTDEGIDFWENLTRRGTQSRRGSRPLAMETPPPLYDEPEAGPSGTFAGAPSTPAVYSRFESTPRSQSRIQVSSPYERLSQRVDSDDDEDESSPLLRRGARYKRRPDRYEGKGLPFQKLMSKGHRFIPY